MKRIWDSIFQTVSKSAKIIGENTNRKVHHDVVLMTAGISIVTLLTFLAGDLSGNGQSTLVAYAETPVQTAETESELENTNLEELMIGEEHHDNQGQKKLDGRWNSILPEENQTEKNLMAGMMPEEDGVSESEVATMESESENLMDESETENETEHELDEVSAAEKEETEESMITLSPEEYNILLRIVQAEAGTCDETGKLLVANVILNRMEDEEFPDTVSGVVYQKRQFSPVMNGSINTCKVTMETRNAVNRALQGEDLSEGALYFMNRSKSSGRNVRWFDTNLDFLFQHGDHEFFK